jgi:beta-lactamase class A
MNKMFIKIAGAFFLLIGILFIGLIIFSKNTFNQHDNLVYSAIISQQVSPSVTPYPTLTLYISPTPVFKNVVEKIVNDTLSDTEGNFAVAVKRLDTGDTFFLNEHQVFETASLYKLWVMATTYDFIEKGLLKDTNEMSESIADLNTSFQIASEDAELTEGYVSLSVKDALENMITVSDNYSALLLSKKLTLNKVSNYLKDHGFYESKVGIEVDYPTTTAYDILQFFDKLYYGKLASEKSTFDMINLLKRQKLNNKIPKYLPEELLIAHKTGEIDGYSHDAGILFTPKVNYIIVALTESDNPNEAEDKIASISRYIYDFLQK